jgi:hypothetical protein
MDVRFPMGQPPLKIRMLTVLLGIVLCCPLYFDVYNMLYEVIFKILNDITIYIVHEFFDSCTGDRSHVK